MNIYKTDAAVDFAVDDSECVYITGYTSSPTNDFPTTSGAIDETQNGGSDVFLSKIISDGTVLEYSTFLGGMGGDLGEILTVDSSACIYISGTTTDDIIDFPPFHE